MTQTQRSADELIEIESRLGAHNYHPLDVVLVRGEGVWVWDLDGNRYMDCLSAYSAVNQGHGHPKIRAALIEQASRLPLTSRAFRNDQLPLFYEEICALTRSHKVLPMNSGAEAVETAIQTGLGRTGKLFAEEHDGIEADVTLVGKALSGGFYPMSAVLSNTEVLGVLKPGEHGSTFGGNPLACAVARAALRVLVEEGLIDNAAQQGAYFLAELAKLRTNQVRDVRGRGLMIALEFRADVGGARRVSEAFRSAGLLCKETHENTLRFAPPLVIEREQVDWAFEVIDRVLRAV